MDAGGKPKLLRVRPKGRYQLQVRIGYKVGGCSNILSITIKRRKFKIKTSYYKPNLSDVLIIGHSDKSVIVIGSSFQNHKICTLLISYSDIVRKSKSMKPRFTTERSQVLSAVSSWPLRLLEILPAHQPGDED